MNSIGLKNNNQNILNEWYVLPFAHGKKKQSNKLDV